MRDKAFLMVVFRLGAGEDKYLACPECGSIKFFPSIMLKQKTIRWYSECEQWYFSKDEVNE